MVEVGQWGPEPFLDRSGSPLTSLTISVYESDGTTLADLYTNQDGDTALANPLPTGVATTAAGLDVRGNGNFYAEPGAYVIAAIYNGNEVYRSPITVGADDDGGGSTWPILPITPLYNAAGDTILGYIGEGDPAGDPGTISLWFGDAQVPVDFDAPMLTLSAWGNHAALGNGSSGFVSIEPTYSRLDGTDVWLTPSNLLRFFSGTGVDGTDSPSTVGELADVLETLGVIASHTVTSAQIEDWTDLGNLGATETITGVDDTFVRRKGTLDQACAITLTLADNQQIDLILEQGGVGGFAATFVGVDTWVTSDGNAPVTTSRATGEFDRFYFEHVDGVAIGYWVTEDPAAAWPLTSDVSAATFAITELGSIEIVETSLTQRNKGQLGVVSPTSPTLPVTHPGGAELRVTQGTLGDDFATASLTAYYPYSGDSSPYQGATIMAEVWDNGPDYRNAYLACSIGAGAGDSYLALDDLEIKSDTTKFYTRYPLLLNPTNAAYVPLTIKGAAAQSADLQQWQNSAGTVLAEVAADGTLSIGTMQLSGGQIYNTGSLFLIPGASGNVRIHNGTAYTIFTGAAETTNNIGTRITSPAATSMALAVRGTTSQSANLQEWQDSAGTMLSAIDSTGAIKGGGSGMNIKRSTGGVVALFAFDNAYLTEGAILEARNFSGAGYSHQAKSNYPANITQITKAAAVQTANLQEWQDSAGTAQMGIAPGGKQLLAKFTNLQPLIEAVTADNTIALGKHSEHNGIRFYIGTATQSMFIDGSTSTVQITGSGTRLRFNDAAHFQTTVGAAGGASALPATPTKYVKIKDNSGTEFVIPAYAAT